MPKAGKTAVRRLVASSAAPVAGAAALLCLVSSGTETAVANGDTRTIFLYHAHSKETIAATYLVNGRYDAGVLKQLNWFLRDWRVDEPTTMDPRLFDVVWEVYREAGAGQSPVTVLSAYRSPQTNAALRRRSRAVAKHSQHMLGKAMDTTMPGMSMEQIREIGMKLQHGGVGYYPRVPFVHLDVGSVRSWPRMNYDQLVRLFPDGKTVHLPSSGQPLARYEEARAELEATGNISVPPPSTSKSFFAFLFGGGDDDDEGGATTTSRGSRIATRASRGRTEVAAYAPSASPSDDGSHSFFLDEERRRAQEQPAPLQRAQRDLPRGETYLSPGPQPVAAPAPAAAPEPRTQVAALEPVAARPEKPQPIDEDAARKPDADAILSSAPMPPRRPSDLPDIVAFAPLPPARPAEFAPLAYNAPTANRRDAIATLIGAPMPPRREPVAPARLDRSNFRAMAGAQPTARVTTQSVLGPTVNAVRAAARARQSVLSNSPADAAGQFGVRPNELSTDRFAPAGRQRAALTAAPAKEDD